MKLGNPLAIFLCLVTISPVLGQNYNKTMVKFIKRSLGKDILRFQTRSYPVDNFGLISSSFTRGNEVVSICDMFFCIDKPTPPSTAPEWINMYDYTGNGTGGPVTLKQKEKKNMALSFALPKIYEVLGITVDFKQNKHTDIDLSFSRATFRKLRYDPIKNHILSLTADQTMRKAFDAGTLLMVVEDVVLEDLTVTVRVDKTTAGQLDAKMGAATSGIASKLFDGANLSLKVDRNVEGVYSFKVSHPVVFGTITRKQPGAGELNSEDSFDKWPVINNMPDPSVIK